MDYLNEQLIKIKEIIEKLPISDKTSDNTLIINNLNKSIVDLKQKNNDLENENKKLKQENIKLKDTPKKDFDALEMENINLHEEIKRLKNKSAYVQNNSNQTSNIIMVNKSPIVYENDDRFSDHIFRNPQSEKNTYIKENVGEFLNKLFNSDDK